MAISDAQFLHWVRGESGALPTVLVEIAFAYESGGVQTTGMIYLADRPYRTLPTDAPANQPYWDVVMRAPECSRSISLESLGGRGTNTIGALILNNADDAVGFLLDAIIDAREVRVYLGDFTWARSDFRLITVATVGSAGAENDKQITVRLRDKNYLLDDTIIGDTITTGPNAGKSKPIILGGPCFNVDISPYLYDEANLIYYINNVPSLTTSPTNGTSTDPYVRDNGVGLGPDRDFLNFDNTTMSANAGTETLTNTTDHGFSVNDVIKFREIGGGGHTLFAGLATGIQYWIIAAGLTLRDFRLSLTKGGAAVDITGTVLAGAYTIDRHRYYIDSAAGTLQLSATPAGRVTMDIQANGGDITTSDLHGAALFIIKTFSALAAAEYDEPTFTALCALESSESARYSRAILDRVNILDLLDEIATASRSWYAWDLNGILNVGRLALESIDSATPVDTISYSDVLSDVNCENLALRSGRVIVNWRRNWCEQRESLAASVSQAKRAIWANRFQKQSMSTDPATSGYIANWWDYHKSAIDSNPIDLNCFAGVGATAPGQTVADNMLALFRPWTRVFRFSASLDKYALNPGDCVTLTYPRYGCESGKNCRVVSVNTRLTDRVVDLVLVTQITPDYTSASH